MIVILLAAAVRLYAFTVPESDWDEYMFALVGRELLAGKLPFRTIFDNKPIGLYYVFAAFEAVLGPTVAAMRAVALLSAAVCALLVGKSASILRKTASGVGVMAAAVFLALSLSNGGLSAMSELVAAPFLAAALLVGVRWSRGEISHARFGIMAGACFGAAAQMSYLTIPCCACFFAVLTLIHPGGRFSLVPLVAGAASFALAFLFFLLPYAFTGGLEDYFSLQAAYHRAYKSDVSFAEQLKGLLPLVAKFVLPLSVAIVPLLQAGRWRELAVERRERNAYCMCLSALMGTLIAALASGRSYGHYFLLSLPFLCVLAAWFLASASVNGKRAAGLMMLLLCGTLAARVGFAVHSWSKRAFMPSVAAEAVKKFSRPHDGIFVFNAHHGIYLLAERSLGSRYIFPDHYLQPQAVASLGTSTREVIDSALRAAPRLVVVGNLLASPPEFGYLEGRLRQGSYNKVAEALAGDERVEIYRAD